MNDGPRLDPHTAERMLRGEPTGPPRLAALLAAASESPTEKLDGEEAAVAAFRQARALPSRQTYRRWLTAVGWKAALVGLLLVLAGGTAMAAAGWHLPGPLGNKQPHNGRTPTISDTLGPRTPPWTPHRAPGHQSTPYGWTTPTTPTTPTPTTPSTHPTPALSTGADTGRPHRTKKPKPKDSKSKPKKSTTPTNAPTTPTSGASAPSSHPPAGR